jgi:thiol-disulfide isomerase/thioredoxin
MVDISQIYNNLYGYLSELVSSPVFYVYIGIIVFLIVVSIYIYIKSVKANKNKLKSNDEYYKTDSKGTEGPTADLYIFHVDWCPHSKKALKVLDKFESDNKTVNNIKINYIRVDAEKEEALAEKYNVESYPTLILKYNGNKIIYDANVKPQILRVFLEKSLI